MISYLSTSYVTFPGQLFSNFLVVTWCTGYYYYPALFTEAGTQIPPPPPAVGVAICVVQIFPKSNVSSS